MHKIPDDNWLFCWLWVILILLGMALFLKAQDPGSSDEIAFRMTWNAFAKSVDEVGHRLADGVTDLKAIKRMEKAYKALQGSPYWPKER